MLTASQIDMITTLSCDQGDDIRYSIPVVQVHADGSRSIKGGDAQFQSVLTDPVCVEEYKAKVALHLRQTIDVKISEAYDRLESPVYRSKLSEAREYVEGVSDGDDFPFLSEEASARGITVAEMAGLIKVAARGYRSKPALMEKARAMFITSTAGVTNINQIYLAKRRAEAYLESI